MCLEKRTLFAVLLLSSLFINFSTIEEFKYEYGQRNLQFLSFLMMESDSNSKMENRDSN